MMPNKNDSFFEMVYEVVRLIPHGRVSSYGAIGKYLGAARSARMVGWAMNNAHNCIPPVPAHRVVNRLGMLSGKAHFSNPNAMQERLEQEGVSVLDDQVQHFSEVFWDPNIELVI